MANSSVALRTSIPTPPPVCSAQCYLPLRRLPPWLPAACVRSDALVRQKDVDLANLAELSETSCSICAKAFCVGRGGQDSSHQRVGGGNSGRQSCSPGSAGRRSISRLLYSLSTWRQRQQGDDSPSSFVAADGARVIQPHFAPLGAEPGPTLIFLEDTSLMAERVQQGKLAALGRLSASIAHEIRNPVGAMSHAGQLLAESSNIGADERRLTDIIQSNSERVSTIINNVLQLSRREATKPTRPAARRLAPRFPGGVLRNHAGSRSPNRGSRRRR